MGSHISGSSIPEEHTPSTSSLPRQQRDCKLRLCQGVHTWGWSWWLLRDLKNPSVLVPGPAGLCLAGELHPCYLGEVGSRRFLLPGICPLTQELINYTLKIAN